MEFINQRLREGFDPYAAVKQQDLIATGTILQQLSTVIKILNDGASDNQVRTYQTMRFRIENFIKTNSAEGISMIRVDAEVAKLFKRHLLQAMKLSAKSVNATSGCIAKKPNYRK